LLGLILVLILLVSIGGVNYYIAKRFHSALVTRFSKVKFKWVFLAFMIPAILGIFGFVSSRLVLSQILKNALSIFFAYWLGFFVCIVLLTIVADIVFIILKLFKSSVIKHRLYSLISVSLVIVLSLTMGVYGIINAYDIDHVSYSIKFENDADASDFNIVLISDLHLGATGSEDRVEEIVNEINAMKPDLVCIAGDFFDTDFKSVRNPQKAAQTLKKLDSTYGVFASFGNHDAGSTFKEMADFLVKSNIKALNDEYVVIDDRLILMGRLDSAPIGGYGDMRRKAFKEISLENPNNLPVVVMDHNPSNIDEYDDSVDLILCGHTHKGQIFPASILTDLLYDVDYGYYRKDSKSPQVIVTSGVGYWGMPMRVGTDSEIVSIKIKH